MCSTIQRQATKWWMIFICRFSPANEKIFSLHPLLAAPSCHAEAGQPWADETKAEAFSHGGRLCERPKNPLNPVRPAYSVEYESHSTGVKPIPLGSKNLGVLYESLKIQSGIFVPIFLGPGKKCLSIISFRFLCINLFSKMGRHMCLI